MVPLPRRVLVADPTHYDVQWVINPHMEGHVGGVDRALARAQWEALLAVWRRLGLEVHVVPSVPGLHDLVFAANQSFPSPERKVVLSRMATPERAPEVALFEAWYRHQGYTVVHATHTFEGMGDALWVPGRRLVVAGHGFRTSPEALDALSAALDVPIVRVALPDARFYHLDTALQPLDAHTALVVPEALDQGGLAALGAVFDRLIPVPVDEALRLSCNGWCPDGRHYVVQRGCPGTNAAVRAAGFDVIEVDTSEFLKSGGSVFCTRLALW